MAETLLENILITYKSGQILKSECLPSPWKEVDFNERVWIAVVVPGSEVSRLQDMDDQITHIFVIIDLKLEKEMQLECSAVLYFT